MWVSGWVGWVVGFGGWIFEFRDQLKLELINYRCHGNNLKVYFQTRSEAWKKNFREHYTQNYRDFT